MTQTATDVVPGPIGWIVVATDGKSAIVVAPLLQKDGALLANSREAIV